MSTLAHLEEISAMLRLGEGDTELVRRRQEFRDAATLREGPTQDTVSAKRASIARAGDPSFQVSSNTI